MSELAKSDANRDVIANFYSSIVKSYGNLRFRFRLSLQTGSRTEFPFFWLRPAELCKGIAMCGILSKAPSSFNVALLSLRWTIHVPVDLADTMSYDSKCGPGRPHFHAHADWDAAEKVELKDAIPNYNYTTDEEWDGWEAREMPFHCADAMEGPDNDTVVFDVASSLAVCVNVFIFVSGSGSWFPRQFQPARLDEFSRTGANTTTRSPTISRLIKFQTRPSLTTNLRPEPWSTVTRPTTTTRTTTAQPLPLPPLPTPPLCRRPPVGLPHATPAAMG